MPRLLLTIAFGCGLLAGCGREPEGPPRAAAGGQVLLDGKPVAGASVSFVPVAGGRPSTGDTDTEGRFKVDDALVGEHLVGVTLVKSNLPPEAASTEDGGVPDIDFSTVKTEWIVPQKFSTPKDSGLKATVPPAGTDSLKFELSSK